MQRISKFCKYLPEMGWHPIVVAPQPSAFYMTDEEMLKEVKHVSLQRVAGFDSFKIREKLVGPFKPRVDSPWRWIARRFSWPDTQTGYIPAAFRLAYRLASKVEAVFITAPPWSNLLLARALKRVTELPLVVDMRDPWVRHPEHDKSRWKRASNKRAERYVLESAEAVIAATRAHARDLCCRYPYLASRIHYIPNGFDAEDFSYKKTARRRGPLTICYTGILGLSNINRGTTLYSAIRHLRDEDGLTPSDLRVDIIGTVTTLEEERIRRSGVSSFINLTGHLSHSEAMKRLERADLAWLPYHAEYSDLIVPAKTYEYVGSGTPILAIVNPEHETAAIVRETGTGVVAREGDVEGVVRALRLALKGYFPYEPRPDAIERFERLCETEELTRILDEITRYE